MNSLDLIQKLDQLCLQYSRYQEGNLCYRGGNDPGTWEPDFSAKRQLWQQLCRLHSYCIEVGVNAGHSAVLALEANPNLRYTGIDVCIHRYTKPCCELIALFYPGRFQFLAGGSSLWLPKIDHPGQPTLFSIDGEHSVRQLTQDLVHVRSLACSGDTIWIDDMDRVDLRSTVDSFFSRVDFLYDVAVINCVDNW